MQAGGRHDTSTSLKDPDGPFTMFSNPVKNALLGFCSGAIPGAS